MALTTEAFPAGQARRKGPPCTVALILAELDAKDRDVLEAVLTDKAVQGTTIARVLTAEGHRVASNTVQKHRRRECACSRA